MKKNWDKVITAIKLKIGAIDFKKECELLAFIRSRYSEEAITLRVDANGAFSPDEAMEKLNALSVFDIHSIEQPIQPGQADAMALLLYNFSNPDSFG